jgi:hypothetical protein
VACFRITVHRLQDFAGRIRAMQRQPYGPRSGFDTDCNPPEVRQVFRSEPQLTFGSLKRSAIRPKLVLVDHSVDIGELQQVVTKYVEQYNLLVAAGPVAAAGLLKTFVANNKAVNMAVVGGGVWFAVKELSTPMLKLMGDQFGYLQSIFGAFGG